jgi:hypothetical protein
MNLHLPPNYRINTLAIRPDGSACVVLGYTPCGDFHSSLETATLGWFATEQEAIAETQSYLDTHGDETMNVLKQTDKLFPHLKGEMLADPTRMVLNGFVREVVAQDGNSSRLEIGFEGSKKTAVVNAAQVLKLVSMFGAETEEWKGQAVVLYAERGSAFGSTYCAIRIADMNDSKEAGQYRRYLTAKAKAKPTPTPSPEPEQDTIDFETGELIPTPAPTANAFSTQ